MEPLTLPDLQYGALSGQHERVVAGATKQVKETGGVVHRILVEAVPAADRTVTLRDGDADGDPIVTVVVVPAALSYPAIPIGLAFKDGIRVLCSGAVDLTICYS